jgi:hypothetical protein
VIQLALSLNKNTAIAAISSIKPQSARRTSHHEHAKQNVPPSPHLPSGIDSWFLSPLGLSLLIPSVPEIGRNNQDKRVSNHGSNQSWKGLIWRNNVASDTSGAFLHC